MLCRQRDVLQIDGDGRFSLLLPINDLDRNDPSAVAETMKEFGGARVCESDTLQESSQKRRRGNRDLQEAVYQDVDVCGAQTSGLARVGTRPRPHTRTR